MRIVSMLLTWLMAGSSVPSVPTNVPVDFHIVDASDIALPVMVDGQGPFRFLLDTGSSRSAVSSALADRLSLGAVSRTLMITPSGETSVPMAQLRSLELGGAMSRGVVVMILDRIGTSAAHIDGLVGLDIVRSRAFTIDYHRNQFTWRTTVEGAAMPGQRVPLTFEEGLAVVTLSQGPNSEDTLRLIPDSGADGLVLFNEPGHTLPAFTPVDTVGLRTLSDQQDVRRVRVDGLDVGDLRLRDQLALLVDHPGAVAERGDGLLPLHLFARVTFNGPLGYLVLEGR